VAAPPGSAADLPDDAPKTVGVGVVLVTYRGAEGAPSDARTKDAALAKAKELAAEATKGFADAVKKGDRGSAEDVGTMPRGVLDPKVEYALFTLKKGDVYAEPLDTPRGFWIVKRLR
jgi:parvulin-like peptidyl-prolyl isomerase